MRAVVAAIVMQVTWALFKPLLDEREFLPLFLFVLSLVLLFILKVNIMLVMVGMILFSVVQSLVKLKKGGKV
ncbi:hypothetical protein SDC9_93797 [bioreactor metagenome]|uniref:Chromate transport protein n=1 Tax=bioreactor metagenome TaxID=1076179 RepID=A0A645A1L3_9ZZZZ